MRRRHWWIAGFGVVVVGLLVARLMPPATDIPAGTGYSALELCTRVLYAGDALDRVRSRYLEPRVAPLPKVWNVAIEDSKQVTVSTRVPTLMHPRTAILRPQLGCTVIPPDVDAAQVRAQRFVPAPELPADGRAWPQGEGEVESALLDPATRAIIERHAKVIFTEAHDEPERQTNPTVLLVARGGHLIYERYADGYTRRTPQLGWSMTKSLTALIAGLLVADGKIALDAPVGLPQWNNTPKAAITWRHLLNMAPGLAWFEGYGGASDATQMLFSQANQGAWAADRPLTSQPGTVFTYSTGFTNIAMWRMRQLMGGEHQALYDLYQRRLFAPLGIRGGVIEPDASGTPVGGARGMLRAVDWLRLGQLVANGGTWNGATIVPADYMRFMQAPSPADAGYGGSIWRVESHMIAPQMRQHLPKDLVWFAGFMSQYTIIVPSQQLLVLRMGAALGGTMEHDPARDQVFDLVAELTRTAKQ